MNILVINAGSSSLKYQLMNPETGDVSAKGLCERIGIDGRLTHNANGVKTVKEIAMPTHGEAIASVMDVRIIPTPDGAIEKLAETRPEWAAAMKYFTIPAGTYGDNFEDTQVLGFISNFLVRDDMDEDVVYAWLDYFAELAPTLTNVSKEASEYTMENISAGTCVTPHPGAVKWFADHGVTITDPLA